jgi:predicted metal-binding membrane protein
MPGMEGMPMPGGWSMSMVWMRMPGQTWAGVAASFLGMWIVMTVAMMLPSLVPELWRYRAEVGRTGATRLAWLTALVGIGYFFVWTLLGAAIFPVGIALSALAMRYSALARAVPIAVGAVVLIAGALQFTAWKARRLARRGASSCSRPGDAGTAWRHGIHLGVHCAKCCAGLMAIPLVMGIMDLRVMAAVTAAITAERLAPAGVRVARGVGVVGVVVGLLLLVRATAHPLDSPSRSSLDWSPWESRPDVHESFRSAHPCAERRPNPKAIPSSRPSAARFCISGFSMNEPRMND